MLSGNQAKPGRELSDVVEVLRIADGSSQRARGERTYPGNARQPLARLAGTVPDLDQDLSLLDLLLQHAQVREQSCDKRSERAG